MGHLIFDKRDWNFILNEQLDVSRLLKFKAFEDYDTDVFEQVVSEGIKFAVERIAPVNPLGDEAGCTVEGGFVKVPEAYHPVYKELKQAGWIGMIHSPEFGGQGIPLTVAAPVGEAQSAASQAFAMYGGLTHSAGHLIEAFGTEKLRQLFVEKMYTGEWGGTMCLTEPNAGSEVGDLRSKASDLGDGTWQIQGQKIFISGGDSDLTSNTVHLYLARCEGDPAGTRGISLFVVPRHWVNDDGSIGEFNNVSVVGIEEKLGIHGSATCQLSVGEDGPARGYLVGERGRGMSYMFQMMNEARIACGQQGSALANAAYQQALAYARDRVQGPDLQNPRAGSVAIINHPDVRRNLMFMKAYSEGTRALLARCSMWSDIAAHSDDEVEAGNAKLLLELATPIAKAYSTDKGFKVTELAMQVLGGYGYLKEYPIEQYMRDIKIASLYEGTNGIQALDLVGRKMRANGGQLFMTYMATLGEFLGRIGAVSELADIAKQLQSGQESLGKVAMWLQTTAGEDMKIAILQATPFLELFGDVMVGHMLCEQAVIAAERLAELTGGSLMTSAEQRENDAEIRFYAGKIGTARFFAHAVLQLARSKAFAMTNSSRAALNMVF